MDSELEAMAAIDGALVKLEDDAKARVLRWASDRHKVANATPHRFPDRMNGEAEVVVDLDSITDLAELYHRAAPATDAQRALVAAYWVQRADESDFFEGFRVNTELKNLGHGLTNVTRALDTLMAQKPKPVIQIRKSGTSKQARKRYRITEEGVRRVKQMVVAEGADG